MGRIIRPILTTVLLWSVILTQAATAQTFPDRANTYINDYADLLTTDQEQDLLRTLTELRQNRDIEMTVLTIKRRSDYQQPLTNEAFATALFNHWGIGDRDRNDGILFLVSRLDRDMRIEVGTGYGSKHDAGLKTIIDRVIIQKFRLDNYGTGIVDGVDHTIREIAGVWPANMTRTLLCVGGPIYAFGPVASFSQSSRQSGGLLGALIMPLNVVHRAGVPLMDHGCPVSWMNSKTNISRMVSKKKKSWHPKNTMFGFAATATTLQYRDFDAGLVARNCAANVDITRLKANVA